jgi:ATP:corrinoid adenosyltransferase
MDATEKVARQRLSVLESADTVTEMRAVKHGYGPARQGVEY